MTPILKRNLAVFDIDGTLTDSVTAHQSSFITALHQFGLRDVDTNWGGYKHHTDSFIFKVNYERQFKAEIDAGVIARFETLLLEAITEATLTEPVAEIAGATAFLKQLTDHPEYDVVFATGSLMAPALLKLQQAGIELDEALIITANHIFSRDELVAEAIEKARLFYGRDRYDTIVSFGDGLWDYETARNLKIDFIGIGNTKLPAYGVTSFFADFNEKQLTGLLASEKPGTALPDFIINSEGKISKELRKRGLTTFQQAAAFIGALPYARNTDKEDILTVFKDHCGTCSTKHALLKQLASENNFEGIKLMMGIFKMNAKNSPKIAGTLTKHNLDYIPEAHNYLKYHDLVLDYTRLHAKAEDFIDDLLEEVSILPGQITDYKVSYHKDYLRQWLEQNPGITFSLSELWTIRERCIYDLSVSGARS